MTPAIAVPKKVETYETTRPLVWFDVVGMSFVAVLLVSNVIAQKLIAIGPFTFTAGILIFPVAYVFGDILTEVYGYARSRRVIWTGLAANIFMAVMFMVAVQMEPAPGWPLQAEFAATLGMVPRTVAASFLGYWAGEFVNSYTLARLKVRTGGRMLWLRTITSTVFGEGIDTALFVVVAFAGIFPFDLLVRTAISGWIFKVLYEIAATPLTYAVVRFLKRQEGFDQYDVNTNFSPFRLRL